MRLACVLLALSLPASAQTIDHIITASGFGAYPGMAAPGSWIEIYGSGLAGTTRTWLPADFNGPAAPTALDGVSVTINGVPGYIAYVSPTQINLQLPDNLPVGTVNVVAKYQSQSSAPASLKIAAQQPGLLATPLFNVNGKQYAIATHANGTLVAAAGITGVPAAPAVAGETLIFYGVGFGAVNPAMPSGQIVSGQNALTGKFTMTIGNATAGIQYAGLAPGAVGLDQFNVVVPNNVQNGDATLQFSLNGTVNSMQTLYLPIGGGNTPPAPTNVTAVAGDSSAIISFTGGNGPATYAATCTSGASTATASGTASPLTVQGLTNGTAYQCSVTATTPNGTSKASSVVNVTPTAITSSGFIVTSSAGVNNGTMAADYTCEGTGSTPQLAWAGAPAGTKEFAVLMTTLPGDGSTKWNWVLYHVPGNLTSLAKDSFLIGALGVGSDSPNTVYNPPCSQGPGAKVYTWTVYALSDAPSFSVPASQVTGQLVTDAIASLTLAKASINLSYARQSTTASPNCTLITSSVRASKSGTPNVTCDSTYAYIGSTGMPTTPLTNPMMNGITSTNLQVPTPTNFQGANAWKIPLNPVIAASPTNVVDGPIGVAINGVPIFNPCTQGGCVTGGDTKVLGQLDTCNGHAGRADDYHYHAAPTCMMADQPPSYWDTHPLGWALDGYAIYGYHDADGTTAVRDSICGGNTKTVAGGPQGYSYHVTDASPYVTNCLIGVPSPDLAGQGAKYHPFRQPPVTPFNNTNMTLTTDPTDGYQVLQFTSAKSFTTTETGQDSYPIPAGTYKIRYKQVGLTPCFSFQFVDSSGKQTQPSVSYCK